MSDTDRNGGPDGSGNGPPEPEVAGERLRDRIAGTLVGRGRLVIAVVLVLLLAVSAGVVFLEEESGLPAFELGTEEEEKLEYVEANFSAETDQEVTQLIVREENVFEKETLVATLELQQSIREHESVAPTLRDERPTVGIANVIARAVIQHRNPGVTDPTLDEQIAAIERLSQREIDAVVQELLGKEGNSDAFVFVPTDYERGSTTASSTMVVVFQSVDGEYPVTAAPEHVVESQLAVEELAADHHDDVAVVGSGILTDEEQRALEDTMSVVGPVALLLVVLVLALAYRDLVDLLFGIGGILLVQLWTFGSLGWLGVAFNPVLIAVPVLLIGLAIDFCIHVFMRYRESRTDAIAGESAADTGIETAMKGGLAGVGVTLVWVTVTTSIGFLSNLASPVRPIQELGLIAGIGIVGSFVVFVLFLPPLKVEVDGALEGLGFDRAKRPLGTGGGRVGHALAVGSRAARRTPVAVVVAVLLVTALTTVAAVNVSTSWGAEDNMIDGTPGWTDHLPGGLQPGEYDAKDDLDYANEHYVRHGSEVELLVEGDVAGPGTLQRVAAARERATDQDAVVTLASGEPSSTDPLTTMRRVAAEHDGFAESFGAADTTGDGVPDTNVEALYDELFAVAPDRADEVLHREDGEYVALRMAVSVDPEADGGAVDEQLDAVGAELETDGTAVTVTGEPIVGHIIQQHLLGTLLRSLAITLAAVLALLTVGFRVVHGSATLGVVTLLPVVFAVSWIIGTMYVLGYPLSVLNAIIASLTIGIGIDYSLHVSERFRDELARFGSVEEALARTVRGTGGALLGSAATTGIGFGVLALAIHPPLQQFGTITAIMIGYAFLGAVLVLPSLLALWARYVADPVDTTVEGAPPATSEPVGGE